MEKIKEYKNTIFSVETLKTAVEGLEALVKEDTIQRTKSFVPQNEKLSDEEAFLHYANREMQIRVLDEMWKYDSEDEFFADYRKYNSENPNNYFCYKRSLLNNHLNIESKSGSNSMISIRVTGHTNNRSIIERVFDTFEKDALNSKLPYELIEKPKIFIGHGRNNLWRDLKDHLHDKHSYEVVAYEIGARAGHAIRDILEEMLLKSSFAILVMTAEDETKDGKFRARQNVIHEIGLFQGRLGFNRAIILLEQNTEDFSNIHGIEQIRFSKGNIKETYGDILATVKREFY